MNINFIRKVTPRWVILSIDLLICLFSILFSYYLRFNFDIPKEEVHSFGFVIPFVLMVRLISFMLGRTYSGIVRYTSTRDVQRILFVIALGSSFLIISNVVFLQFMGRYMIPMSVVIIDFITTTFVLTFFRLIIKTVFLEFNNLRKEKTNLAILGTSELGLITKRTLDRDASTVHNVTAFIGYDSNVVGNKIEGVKVYHIDVLESLIAKNEIKTVIIAARKLPMDFKQQVVDQCLDNDVKVLTIPEVNQWINGELSFRQIKSIRIDDLLERPPIRLDKKRIRSQVLNKTLLVTGAAGSIGSEIVRQVMRFKPRLIVLFDQAETPLYDLQLELSEFFHCKNFEVVIGDITDLHRVQSVFKKYAPDLVYHAAAYKHVPLMEGHPAEAIRTNVLGTKTVADAAVENGVKRFVMVSTDKAVNPTSVMGASKRIAEIYTQMLNKKEGTKFITTRFGNVLGSNGSVIPRFQKQIEKGGPVTITHPDVTRFFMTIPEACQLVLEAGSMGSGGEIFIFDMGERVKIINLAKRMIKLSGLELGTDIQLKFTGLRPGEKLYEELLANMENTLPTYNEKIMIAKVRSYDSESVGRDIRRLEELSNNGDKYALVKQMKQIIPEFLSQNSEYEELDAEHEAIQS